MREAVARFFEGKHPPKLADGRIAEWLDDKTTREGRLLTVAATGQKPKPGSRASPSPTKGRARRQTTSPTPSCRLLRNNKLRIPFVQGKFNMGGTGAFQFSKLQLVVSRRNPALLGSDSLTTAIGSGASRS